MNQFFSIKEDNDLMFINVATVQKIGVRDPQIKWKIDDVDNGEPYSYSVRIIKLMIITDEVEYHIHVKESEAAYLLQCAEGYTSASWGQCRLNVINIDEPHLKPAG